MKTVVKALLALVLLFGSIFCLQRFRAGYVDAEVSRAGLKESDSPAVTAEANPPAASDPVSNPGTASNEVANVAAPSNVVAVVEASKPAPAPVPASGTKDARPSKPFGWLGGFVAGLLLLAGFVAWEVAQWFSRRTGSVVFSEDAPSETDPEYDAAEAEWAKGNHLDAIAMMRDYLKKNPREQYVSIRIAEIYEKDLSNPLAATLELEEVLTQPLSREKWGWTAIHLANLYSGTMNQPSKAIALLERILAEYPETGAAKKARARLGVSEAAPAGASQAAESGDDTSDPENPNLPRGFSAKKR